VVEFSYTGDCPQIEPDTVVDLYQASHQYMLLELRKRYHTPNLSVEEALLPSSDLTVFHLVRRCENIIEEAVGVDNAVPIYEVHTMMMTMTMTLNFSSD
jgi:hypothetical protein